MSSTATAEPFGEYTPSRARPAATTIPARLRVPSARVLAVAAAGAGLAFVDATIVNVA